MPDYQELIQILITKPTEIGTFQDAIYMTQAERDALTDEDIQTKVDKRASDWVKKVKEDSKKIRPDNDPLTGEPIYG